MGFGSGVAVTGLAKPAVILGMGLSDTDVDPTGNSRAAPPSEQPAGSTPIGQIVSLFFNWKVFASRAAVASGGFMTPTGIAVDGRGVTLVTLTDDDRVWVIRNDGSPPSPWDLSVAGVGFQRPGSVALTSSGTVLVADTGNHRVIHMSSVDAPRVITVIGGSKPGTAVGEFLRPRGAVASDNGRITVADTGNHRIQSFDREGRSLSVWGRSTRGVPKSGSAVGEFASPCGVGVGADGRILVADTGNNRVQSHAMGVAAQGVSAGWEIWPSPALDDPMRIGNYRMPSGIAVDQRGRTLIADSGNHRIVVRDERVGTWEAWGGRAGTAPGQFVMPMGISIGPGGQVVVADTGNDRLQVATLRPSTSA